jgi:hypothetical protein
MAGFWANLLKKSEKKKKEAKTAHLQRNMKGIIVISPWLWLAINGLVLGMVFLIYGDQTYLRVWEIMGLIFGALNGWLAFVEFFPFLLRHNSHKMVCANISTSLGEEDGDPKIIPPVMENGKEIRIPLVCRNGAGFNTEHYDVHHVGKVPYIYPLKAEIKYPGGGISSNAWVRPTPVKDLPKHVKEYLENHGEDSFRVKPDTEIWFTEETFYDINPMDRQRIDVDLDMRKIELENKSRDLQSVIDAQAYKLKTLAKENNDLEMAGRMFGQRPPESPPSSGLGGNGLNQDEEWLRQIRQGNVPLPGRRY